MAWVIDTLCAREQRPLKRRCDKSSAQRNIDSATAKALPLKLHRPPSWISIPDLPNSTLSSDHNPFHSCHSPEAGVAITIHSTMSRYPAFILPSMEIPEIKQWMQQQSNSYALGLHAKLNPVSKELTLAINPHMPEISHEALSQSMCGALNDMVFVTVAEALEEAMPATKNDVSLTREEDTLPDPEEEVSMKDVANDLILVIPRIVHGAVVDAMKIWLSTPGLSVSWNPLARSHASCWPRIAVSTAPKTS